MWYTIGEEGRGRSPWPYFFLLDLLDLLSRFVLTIRQMAVTIASSASERSLIISLTDSFICCSPPFYDLIIARIYVLVKGNITILQGFLHLLIDGKCFFLTQNIGYESEVSLMALTPKQKIFANEYLIDLNATRAYKVAYPRVRSDEVAKAAASRLLTNVNVASYIEKRMKDREHRTEITQDRVLQELAKIGFADVTDFVTIEGRGSVPVVKVKATDDMPRDKLGAIAGIKEGANGIEIKLNDKGKALELIGRHLGMWNDKVQVSGQVETNNPYAGLTTEELRKLIHGG
nr:MAG TPA: Terminase small subunit [Caudoviricetes sp.]